MSHNPELFLAYNKQFRNWQKRIEMLSDAAHSLSITPVLIDAEAFDYSNLGRYKIGDKDMFYNVTPFSHEVENFFVSKKAKTFFTSPSPTNYLFSTHQLDLPLINAGIPVPKTILKGTNKRDLLKKYCNYVGGFPLILKITGGTLGIGVIKIESWENLISTADMLNAKGIHFQLKEYIENKGTIRTVVIGNRVICNIIRLNPTNDFRCSSPEISSRIVEYTASDKLKKLAVKVSKAVNYEFIGIDFIKDEHGNYLVLEVNFPNDFSIPAEHTKVDIAKEAILHLNGKD